MPATGAGGENLQLAPGGYVLLEVIDKGPGMSLEVAKRGFAPFLTAKGRDGRTGLGLAIVRGYAEQPKGAAEIESRPGTGTAVRVHLPLDPDRQLVPPAQ